MKYDAALQWQSLDSKAGFEAIEKCFSEATQTTGSQRPCPTERTRYRDADVTIMSRRVA
jgi:hypothetical protein